MAVYRNEHVLRDGRKLIVRNPEAADAESLISLVNTADTETRFLAREPGEFDMTPEKERELIESRVGDENTLWIIAELDGRITGSCNARCVRNHKRFRHRAQMGIMIIREFWGMGIGGKLMQETVGWCKRKGIEQLELEVASENKRALDMYQSFGFEIQGIVKRAMKYSDGTYADDYFMCLFL